MWRGLAACKALRRVRCIPTTPDPSFQKEGREYAGCEDLPYAAVRKTSRLSARTFSRKCAICLSDRLCLRAKSNVV